LQPKADTNSECTQNYRYPVNSQAWCSYCK
jgi:hypothetical protein